MSPRMHAVIFKPLHVRGNPLMAVKRCSKALLTLGQRHGKSPCFLLVTFLWLFSPDYPMLVLPRVDGAKTLECAF